MSFDDFLKSKRDMNSEGQAHTMNLGENVMVPRGRADWNAEKSSVDMIEKASGKQFY